MLNPSNSLSLLRAPLALLFLFDNVTVRLVAVIVAMITDFTDGFLARRFKYSSKLGAILDPLMDKFFVFFVLGVFLVEDKLTVTHSILMISRDIFLVLFGLYLAMRGQLKAIKFRSVRWGKISTTLQFAIIILLTLGFTVPYYVYWLFILFGIFVFIELIKISALSDKNS